jgi:hypothetical protein
MPPQPGQKLNAGFQRRVDEQAASYAPRLEHAGQLAARFGCGQVAGVFTRQVGGTVPSRAYLVGSLPLIGIPVLMAAAYARVGGVLPLLFLWPFIAGAWFGVSLFVLRTPKRAVWWYACTEGFMLLDDQQQLAAPVRWAQVTGVSEVWTQVYRVDAEESRPALTAFRLHLADGQAVEIARSFQNVQDPYGPVGQLVKRIMPAAGQVLPDFPTADQIIAAYAMRR